MYRSYTIWSNRITASRSVSLWFYIELSSFPSSTIPVSRWSVWYFHFGCCPTYPFLIGSTSWALSSHFSVRAMFSGFLLTIQSLLVTGQTLLYTLRLISVFAACRAPSWFSLRQLFSFPCHICRFCIHYRHFSHTHARQSCNENAPLHPCLFWHLSRPERFGCWQNIIAHLMSVFELVSLRRTLARKSGSPHQSIWFCTESLLSSIWTLYRRFDTLLSKS